MAIEPGPAATASSPARSLREWDDLWRPELWRTAPEHPQRSLVPIVGLVALIVYANAIANEVLSPPWYVPFNAGILAAALVLAHTSGITWTSMGMRADRVRRGLLVGGLIGAVIVACILVLAAIPWTAEVLEDERIVDRPLGLALYHAFIRVPLGTAVYEEMVFRGILFGMLARRTTALAAAVWSSALFGLWHVLPTIDALATNPAGELLDVGPLGVLAGVAATFLAGLVFVWLRCFGGSIVTPILVHIATNSTVILVGAVVTGAI